MRKLKAVILVGEALASLIVLLILAWVTYMFYFSDCESLRTDPILKYGYSPARCIRKEPK